MMSVALITERLIARMADAEDAPSIAGYFLRNREHIAPSSPLMPEATFTEEFWEARAVKAHEEFRAGTSLRLFLFAKQEPELVIGVVSYTQMFRAAFQACYLGYNLDKEAQGIGLMCEALVCTNAYVFGELNFHRIMANHLPENTRSGKLLERLGFTREGVAKDYLLIDGAWRDHVLTSLTNPAWRAP